MTKEISLTEEEIETIQLTAFRQGMRRALQEMEPLAMSYGWHEWSILKSKLTVGFSLDSLDSRVVTR